MYEGSHQPEARWQLGTSFDGLGTLGKLGALIAVQGRAQRRSTKRYGLGKRHETKPLLKPIFH